MTTSRKQQQRKKKNRTPDNTTRPATVSPSEDRTLPPNTIPSNLMSEPTSRAAADAKAAILQILGDGLVHLESDLHSVVRGIVSPELLARRAREHRLVSDTASVTDALHAGAQSYTQDALIELRVQDLVRDLEHEGHRAWQLAAAHDPLVVEPRGTTEAAAPATREDIARVVTNLLQQARALDTLDPMRFPLKDEFLAALGELDATDRAPFLHEGAKVFRFTVAQAQQEVARRAAGRALALVLGPFDGWLAELEGPTPGQRRAPEETELLLPLRDLARVLVNADPLVREMGQEVALSRLTQLGFPKRRAQELLDAALEAALAQVDAAELDPAEREGRLAELRVTAAPVLTAPDPLVLVREAIGRLYGGDPKVPEIIYLAITTRVLAQYPGSMPAHTFLTGPSSVGKSYGLKVACRLFPGDAVVEIDAGSPRVLIYDSRPVAHRAVIFAESDSIPNQEDNPAASAIRHLLQENELRWQVVEHDPEEGGYYVRTIRRLGPSVLLTTGVKRLPDQMDTRTLSLELTGEADHVRAALRTQAHLELHGLPEPDPALIAYQELLQLQAPWVVTVPFAAKLSEALGRQLASPRVLRDFLKIISLIKAVAVLRHAHRERDEQGRLVATLEDYKTVYELVGPMYEGATTGATDLIRRAVEVVRVITNARPGGATRREVAKALGLSEMTGWRHIQKALRRKWLVNTEPHKHRPARLDVGEPMPEEAGLPRPEQLGNEGGYDNSDNSVNSLTAGDSLTIPQSSQLSFQLSQAPPSGDNCGEPGGIPASSKTGQVRTPLLKRTPLIPRADRTP